MLNNQASIAGLKNCVNHSAVAGEPLSCADQIVSASQLKRVSAAPLDQQAIGSVTTLETLPADQLSPVDGQMMHETPHSCAVDHPSMSEGHGSLDSQNRHASARLQEPAVHFTIESLRQDDGMFDLSGAGGQFVDESHAFDAARPTISAAGSQIYDTKSYIAACCLPLDDDGQRCVDDQLRNAEVVTPHYRDPETIARIKTLYKQRNDIIRAHGNLTRQVTSICYHAAGFNTFLPEKERAAAMKAGNRLLAALKIGDPAAETVFDSAGYLLGVIERSEFDKQKRLVEKKMAVAVGSLDMDLFIEEVRGFSHTQLANIIGEAGDIANYGTVSRLWKRMGLAVIDGVRQSKQTDKSKALDHGYNPSRRSAMWNIGETIIKAQVRNIKDEDGNKTGESSAIGYLGQVYLDRKKDYAARHHEKSKAHIHNDAKRYMEKRLLKMLWQAWNK